LLCLSLALAASLSAPRLAFGAELSAAGNPAGEPEPKAAGAAKSRPPVPAAPSPLNLAAMDESYNDAYLDAYNILSEDNSCSRFYGGGARVVEVLNKLSLQLRKTHLPKGVGIRMSGAYAIFKNNVTGASYRMFEDAAVNLNGPFYRHARAGSSPRASNIGSYQSGTRRARALMLLHELGHLITGTDGGWLLPDDGHDLSRSDQNTKMIERVCGEQLQSLT
jgi:hypothetical protein